MSQIYSTPEWRSARDKFIKDQGGICVYCDRHEGDIVEIEDRKGKIKRVKITLAPHHIKLVPLGLPVYKKLCTQAFSEHFGSNGSRNNDEWTGLWADAQIILGMYSTPREIRARMKHIWNQKNQDMLKKKYAEYKEQAKLDYLDLTPEKAIIICQRCHYAREHGMVLCQKCKTYYIKANSRYKTCYRCSKHGGS